MYHMSANLAFGRREKNIWGYKKLQGGKKPIRKTEKKVATFFFFFFFFFWETVKNLWGRQKMSRGAPNGNVTPLGQPCANRPKTNLKMSGRVLAFPFNSYLKIEAAMQIYVCDL